MYDGGRRETTERRYKPILGGQPKSEGGGKEKSERERKGGRRTRSGRGGREKTLKGLEIKEAEEGILC